MNSIHERLLRAEDDFLSAIIDGPDAVAKFDESWSTLYHDIDSATHSHGIDDETTALIHTTATTIKILADGMVQLSDYHEAFTSSMVEEVETILSRLTIADMPSAPSAISYSNKPTNCRKDYETERHLGQRRNGVKRTRRNEEARSLVSSPGLSSSSTSSDEGEDDVSHKLSKGFKRSVGLLYDTEAEGGYVEILPKRGRTEGKFCDNPSQASSPSSLTGHDFVEPNASAFECLPSIVEAAACWSASSATCESSQPYAGLSSRRKRRLSDADSCPAPKRPKGVPGPRTHAVSDPLPLSVNQSAGTFDDWFQLNFDIPENASSADLVLEPSLPLDIGLSRDWASMMSFSANEPSTVETVHATQQINLPVNANLQDIMPESLDILNVEAPVGLQPPPIPSYDAAVTPEVIPSYREGLSPSWSLYSEAESSLRSCDVSSFLSDVTLKSDYSGDGPQEESLVPKQQSSPALSKSVPLAASSKKSIAPELLELYATSFNPESSPSGKGITRTSYNEQLSTSSYPSPPPSFLDSMDTKSSLSWNQFWDPFEYLPEFGFANPPPPYHPSSEAGNLSNILSKAKPSDLKPFDPPAFGLHIPDVHAA